MMNIFSNQPGRRQARIGRRLPVALAIATLVASLAGPADAVVATWTGGGGSGNWSDSANWAGGVGPGNGISLSFQGGTGLINQNDSIGLHVHGISFASTAGAFTLNGAAITLFGDISNTSSQVQTIQLDLSLAADSVWDGGSQGMVFNGVVSGLDGHDLDLHNRVTVNNFGHDLTVGDSQGASLMLASGSQLYADNAAIGRSAGGQGDVFVTGSGSSLNLGDRLDVGADGVGRLIVTAGGAVNTAFTFVGAGTLDAKLASQMVVSGAGSALNNSDRVYVTNGSLRVDAGGRVTTFAAYLAAYADSHAEATVQGDGSLLQTTIVRVGGEGTATMAITNGGSLTAVNVVLGGDSEGATNLGNGTVTVDGKNSSFSSSDYLVIGYTGTGTLNVTGGARATSSFSAIADQVGSYGSVLVSGAQSTWTVSGDLNVGGQGSGTLTIADGGQLTSSIAFIGRDSVGTEASGSVRVTGNGSRWDGSDTLYLNNGALNIDAGGVVTLAALEVAAYSGSNSRVTVQDEGSQLRVANGIYLATEDDGAAVANLTIGAGASVSASALTIGRPGSLSLDGGTLNLVSTAQSINHGQFDWRSGTLHFSGDASFEDGQLLGNTVALRTGMSLAVDGLLNLGEATTLALNGGRLQGGTINLSGLVTVGLGSTITTATRLSNFGSLQLAGGTLDGEGILYNTAEMSGWGRIDGSGGFTNSGLLTQSGGNLVLANSGNNTNLGTWNGLAGRQLVLSGADLLNQGQVNLNGGLVTGDGALVNTALGTIGGSGRIDTVFINQGSLVVDAGLTTITQSFTNRGQIFMGANSATLAGGQIGNHGLIQGYGKVSSNISNIDPLGVIEAQGGTLTLSGLIVSPNGGTLAAGSGAKLLISQGLASNAGQIQLSGGTLDNNNKLMLNASNGVISGYGTLRTGGLTQNGQIQLSGGSAVPSSIYGSVLANSGSKTILSGNSNATFYGTVDVQGGAELRVSTGSVATFFGLVQQRTGALFTGSGAKRFEGGLSVGASPGLGTDEGDVEFGDGNVYLAEIGGITACTLACGSNPAVTNSSYDKYIVGGQLSLGGTLKMVSWNGFVGQIGQQFDLLDWGSVTGSFAAVDASGFTLAAGATLDLSEIYTSGKVSVTAVPEPGTLALWLAGLVAVGGIARRTPTARTAAPAGSRRPISH